MSHDGCCVSVAVSAGPRPPPPPPPLPGQAAGALLRGAQLLFDTLLTQHHLVVTGTATAIGHPTELLSMHAN
jgi:hypothetical protein